MSAKGGGGGGGCQMCRIFFLKMGEDCVTGFLGLYFVCKVM